MVHLFIFWPSPRTLESLCHPASPDWHFCKLLGIFAAVTQTLSDSSPPAGTSCPREPQDTMRRCFCFSLFLQSSIQLYISFGVFLLRIICFCLGFFLCASVCLHVCMNQSPMAPRSYTCLALLPNLPDLPQINLSAVIKSYLFLSTPLTLTYAHTLGIHTHIHTGFIFIFIFCICLLSVLNSIDGKIIIWSAIPLNSLMKYRKHRTLSWSSSGWMLNQCNSSWDWEDHLTAGTLGKAWRSNGTWNSKALFFCGVCISKCKQIFQQESVSVVLW